MHSWRSAAFLSVAGPRFAHRESRSEVIVTLLNGSGKASAPLSGQVLVCVDDEAQILESLKRALRDEPYELLATEWPLQALDWVRERSVTLVLCDQRMADMSGLRVLGEVAKLSPETGRMILTGYRSGELIIECLKQGIRGIVYKPWNDAALQRTLRKALGEVDACRNRNGFRPAVGLNRRETGSL